METVQQDTTIPPVKPYVEPVKVYDTDKPFPAKSYPVDKKPIVVANRWDDKNIVIVNDINQELIVDDPKKIYQPNYPFNDLKVDQGFFVPNEKGTDNNKALELMRKDIALAHDYYSEAEVNVDGDAVWENVIVKTRARNPDGTLKLVDGKVVEGADSVMRPVLISSRQFVIRAIVKEETLINGKKSVDNGVLVIRVA